jgi:3'(2'), 5'-bisphosphate nucleotidase
MYFGGKDWGLFQATATEAAIALPVVEPKPPTAGFCPILIGHRDQKRYGPAIAEYIPEAQFYSIGSFGLKVLEVIMGHAGLYLYLNQRVKLWDTTGPLAMARMAGLTCCSLEGEPLRFSPDAIDPQTLAHRQSIVIGWPHYVEELRPKLESAVKFALQN